MKNMVRTKNPVKHGCLSKSLDNFLSMNDKERKKKYGNNVHKYWDRIVAEVKASFDDHTRAYANLPENYAKKINFTAYYHSMMGLVMEKKWVKEAPKDALDDLIDNFNLAHQEVRQAPFQQIADDDFNRVEKWLYYLKELRKDKKIRKEIVERKLKEGKGIPF